MEDRSPHVDQVAHTLSSLATISDGVEVSMRKDPPADCTLKIQRFSQLLQTGQSISDSFEAGGYKWRIVLYPNGDKRRNISGYISLYLVATDTYTLPSGWEVNVNFKLLVYDQIHDKYHAFQDVGGNVAQFDQRRTENGLPKLISHAIFNDTSNGYLVDDSCTFGAEVFVIKNNSRKVDSITTIPQPLMGTCCWKVPNFSKLKNKWYNSPIFDVAGKKWILLLFPRRKYLSIELFLYRPEPFVNRNFVQRFWKRNAKIIPLEDGCYAECRIRVKDQVHGQHKTRIVHGSFSYELNGSWAYRFTKFMRLADLKDESKGFLRNDTFFVQVAFDVVRDL